MFARPAGTGFFLASHHLRREPRPLPTIPWKLSRPSKAKKFLGGRVCSVQSKRNLIFSWSNLGRLSIWDGIIEVGKPQFDVTGVHVSIQNQISTRVSNIQIYNHSFDVEAQIPTSVLYCFMYSERIYIYIYSLCMYLNSMDRIDSVRDFCETFRIFNNLPEEKKLFLWLGHKIPFIVA